MAQMDRATAESWVTGFQAGSDTLQPDQWIPNWFTDDAEVRFANNPELVGSEAIRQAFAQELSKLQYMKHRNDYFEVVGSRILLSCHIDYVANGDDPATHMFTFPAFGVFYPRLVGDKWLCGRMEIYMDQGPLVARIAEKQRR